MTAWKKEQGDPSATSLNKKRKVETAEPPYISAERANRRSLRSFEPSRYIFLNTVLVNESLESKDEW